MELRGEVDQAGACDATRPQIDIAEGVGAERAHAAFVVVGKKFGFIGRYVDSDGAIALHPLQARQRSSEFLTSRYASRRGSFHPFDLRPGSSPRADERVASGVFFFVRDAPAGHITPLLRVGTTDADATQRRLRQAAVIVGELKIGFRSHENTLRRGGDFHRACRAAFR